jgi:hypothetical protein
MICAESAISDHLRFICDIRVSAALSAISVYLRPYLRYPCICGFVFYVTLAAPEQGL